MNEGMTDRWEVISPSDTHPILSLYRTYCLSVKTMNLYTVKKKASPHPHPLRLIAHSTLVPNTADRGSGVGQMSPNLKTKGGAGDYTVYTIQYTVYSSFLYGSNKLCVRVVIASTDFPHPL